MEWRGGRRATFFKLTELEEDTFPIESDEWGDEGEPLSTSEYKGFSLMKDVPNYIGCNHQRKGEGIKLTC